MIKFFIIFNHYTIINKIFIFIAPKLHSRLTNHTADYDFSMLKNYIENKNINDFNKTGSKK